MNSIDIIKQLDSCEDIIKNDLGDNIYSYNFSRHVFYRDLWNDLTCKARGLFINKNDNTVLARSYDKFFYINPDTDFKYPIRVYIKENGFLGILSWNKVTNKPFIATKSTNKGKHVEIFEKRLREAIKDKNYLTEELMNFDNLCDYLKENNVSMVFEVIDTIEDPHIISYKSNGVILLDVIYNDFEYRKYTDNELTKISKKFLLPCKFLTNTLRNDFELNKWLEVISSPNYRNELEGFVLEDANGFMCKVKTPFYNLWKKVRTLKDLIISDRTITATDIRSVEELDIFRFMKSIPKEILEDMSIPTIRDRYFFEKFKKEHNFS